MKFEPVQKGNPHQLTVKQHILPSKSIARFANKKNHVDLFNLTAKKRLQAKPSDSIFCVNRSWDERTEKGFGKDIEDSFQSVAEKILKRDITANSDDHCAITRFYCLLRVRHHYSDLSLDNQKLGVQPEYILNIDDREQFEKSHIVYINDSGEIPARIWRGLLMQSSLDSAVSKMIGVRWGVLTSEEGEFLVSDNSSPVCVIPINPKQCLAANCESKTIRLELVRQVNTQIMTGARRFIFARNLDQCPDFSDHLKSLTI